MGAIIMLSTALAIAIGSAIFLQVTEFSKNKRKLAH
jgi:hypothetical protein